MVLRIKQVWSEFQDARNETGIVWPSVRESEEDPAHGIRAASLLKTPGSRANPHARCNVCGHDFSKAHFEHHDLALFYK